MDASSPIARTIPGPNESEDIALRTKRPSTPPPPPSRPLSKSQLSGRPARTRRILVPKTSDPSLLIDLTDDPDEDDGDVHHVVFKGKAPAPAPAPSAVPPTPRKTPKRPAERDADSDVEIIGESPSSRIHETPTKRIRSGIFQRGPPTASTGTALPPRVTRTAAASASGSGARGGDPETPSKAHSVTMFPRRPPTPPSRNQPVTPQSRGKGHYYGSGSGSGSVVSQFLFSPVSTVGVRRDESPSPLSRRQEDKMPQYIQDLDSDEDDDAYEYDGPVDVDALYDQAQVSWYAEAQDAGLDAPANGNRNGNQNANGAPNVASLDGNDRNDFIRRRPVSLADVWNCPLNDNGEPTFPALGPDCRFCHRPTQFRRVSTQNPNGNALRPYYVCQPCDTFFTWADKRGIKPGNPRCWCRVPSREDKVGKDPRGEKILRPGTPFWACWQRRCNFFRA